MVNGLVCSTQVLKASRTYIHSYTCSNSDGRINSGLEILHKDTLTSRLQEPRSNPLIAREAALLQCPPGLDVRLVTAGYPYSTITDYKKILNGGKGILHFYLKNTCMVHLLFVF